MKTETGVGMLAAVLLITAFIAAPRALAGGPADFNNDGRSDVFWRNSATGENYLYPLNGTAIALDRA